MTEHKRSRLAQDRLTQAAAARSMPTFNLDDFEDIVAFQLKCDSIAKGSSHKEKITSLKICPNCH